MHSHGINTDHELINTVTDVLLVTDTFVNMSSKRCQYYSQY